LRWEYGRRIKGWFNALGWGCSRDREDILGNMDGWVVCSCVWHMFLRLYWDILGVSDSGCPLSSNLAGHQQALSPLKATVLLM